MLMSSLLTKKSSSFRDPPNRKFERNTATSRLFEDKFVKSPLVDPLTWNDGLILEKPGELRLRLRVHNTLEEHSEKRTNVLD